MTTAIVFKILVNNNLKQLILSFSPKNSRVCFSIVHQLFLDFLQKYIFNSNFIECGFAHFARSSLIICGGGHTNSQRAYVWTLVSTTIVKCHKNCYFILDPMSTIVKCHEKCYFSDLITARVSCHEKCYFFGLSTLRLRE